MLPNNDILLVLIVFILMLTIVIAVLIWLIRQRHELLERRREVIEREERETEMLLKERAEGVNDIPKFRDIERELEHPQLTIKFKE